MPEAIATIRVERGYVSRWLAIAVAIAGIVHAGLTFLLFRVEGAVFLALLIGDIVAVLVLAIILAKTYRNARHQAIHLHPRKIVFDYATGVQTFEFQSPEEWVLSERGGDWVIAVHRDGSSKAIPKAAFPSLRKDVQSFYGVAT